MEPVQLTTTRLLLRPYRLEDVDGVFDYAKDEDWARYLLNVPWPYTRDDAAKWIAQCLLAEPEKNARFVVVLDGTPIGGAGMSIDPKNQVAELGYSLGVAHWGKGYATESARAVLDYGFEERELAVVFARCDVRNPTSVRVMQKLGMRPEGVLRGRIVHRGERVDMHHYAINREEWEARRSGSRTET